MKKNIDIMKPRYSEQILMVPWPFILPCFWLLLIVDFQYGLNMVFQSEDGLTLLARSMDANHTSMMTDVVKVMAAVCLVK